MSTLLTMVGLAFCMTLSVARAADEGSQAAPTVMPGTGAVYDKLELKNGDVIRGLNGQRPDSPQRTFEMFGQVKATNLEIVREGETQTVEQNAPDIVEQASPTDAEQPQQ